MSTFEPPLPGTSGRPSTLPPPPAPPPGRRWKGVHVAIAAVLGLVLGAAVGYVAHGSDDTSDVTTTATTSIVRAPDTTSRPPVTAATSTAARATTSTAAPTTTAASGSGTRAQPVPVGTPVTISSKDANWTVKVTAADLDASAAVMKANSFNKPAPAGVSYVLVTLEATYNGPKDSSSYLLDLRVKGIDSSNVETKECSDYGAYSFGSGDVSKEVFQKGTVTIRECLAPAADVVSSLVLIVSPSFSSTTSRSFLAVK